MNTEPHKKTNPFSVPILSTPLNRSLISSSLLYKISHPKKTTRNRERKGERDRKIKKKIEEKRE
jgi:hypothetical protein